MCHERRPRKGNELDDEAGGSWGGEARRKKGRREKEGEGRPRSDRARGPAPGAGWGKGALVKHCARLYPRGKFLKRNYAPIEMSVSRKWMGPLRRDGGGAVHAASRRCIISALSTRSGLPAHRYGLPSVSLSAP